MKNNYRSVDEYLLSISTEEPESNFDSGNIPSQELAFEDSDSEFAGGYLKIAKPYVLTISTSAPTNTLTAILFGYNDYFNQTNFGSDTGAGGTITVSSGVSGVPYRRMLSQSQNKPFEIGYWRISCSNTSQLAQVITVNYVDANGRSASDPIAVSIYQDSYQNISTVVDITDYNIKIDGNTYLSIPVLAGVTDLTFIFYPVAIVDAGRVITGGNLRKDFRTPKLNALNADKIIIE